MSIARQGLLFVPLIAAVAVAQTDLRTATVDGVVRNLKTGEPLADVRVAFAPEFTPAGATPAANTAKNATTDADGKFSITGIQPGRYLVNATRTLFFRARKDAGPLALTMSEGHRLSGVQILLSPTAVIAGRVTDDKREPLRSVRVEALRREFREGLWIWVNAAQNTSDDRGE
ncbi:MAG TPA: carboxypeptidase-like regulatory domain-containing protein, partial [Terriglobia bacterium]|nr:carboxypeptidase-like regulatory domain-containing protein [Terriglobia bacterium]